LQLKKLSGRFASWFAATNSARRTRQAERVELLNELERFQSEGFDNLETVSDYEMENLAFILRTGKKRFSGDFFTHFGASGLVEKKIIHRDPTARLEDVWMVNDMVWAYRDRLLETYRKAPTRRPSKPGGR
jgi:hypothetical protein